MKKIFLTLLFMFIFILNAQAKTIKRDFSTVINDSGVDIESIAVSIKDLDSGKVVYSLNDKMLINPASVQKIYTTPVIADVLGYDYKLNTEIYKRKESDVLIKLGADPYLTSKDLKTLIKNVDKSLQTVYIDDSILDTKIWGEGWQWDDDMNILMPRFGAYNLDKNLVKLTIVPSQDGQFATIMNPTKYPFVIFNYVKNGTKTDLDVHRDNAISPNTLMVSGTVARPTTIYIPNNNLKRYFDMQLTNILAEKNIYLKTNFIFDKQNEKDVLVEEISHDINTAYSDILKNSNNLISETLFKLAGRKYANLATGSDSLGIKMFNDYCVKNNIDNTRIKIVDGSGVSKNNLVSADFVTNFLELNKTNKIMDLLPKPGEGTLTHRMLPIRDNLRAKTGTLSDISSIAGYLTSKSGKKFAFCIIINDIKLSNSDKKMLEDFIIREAYIRL